MSDTEKAAQVDNPDSRIELATDHISGLADLGWRPFFSDQLDAGDLESAIPVRVMAVHRSSLQVAGASFDAAIQPFYVKDGEETDFATVGDWLLLDRETKQAKTLLRRMSLFKRRAPGTGRKLQLIAANVDTLFIVTSCNQDYNQARLERFLTMAREADVDPVIILTKADLTDTPQDFAREAGELLPDPNVVVLDARDPGAVERLLPWCGKGQTVAFVGSSGVGKSTLINSLTGSQDIATQGIREDDAKGRHTTSGREMHRLRAGGLLLDTPGMRELQLTDVQTGIDDVFADIAALAASCKFSDCRHQTEPGCAVRAAIKAGDIDENRLQRWKKLVAEEVYNNESMAERRTRGRAFGKMIKRVKQETQK